MGHHTSSIGRLAPWHLIPIALLAGCASPLDFRSDQELRTSVRESARRELAEAAASTQSWELQRSGRVDELQLKPEVLRELAEMAGPEFHRKRAPNFGESLLGNDEDIVYLTLERAVASAIEHNLNLQFARLDPAISGADVVAAEAAFDWTFFSNFTWNKTDQARTSPSIGGQTVGVQADERQALSFDVGIQKATRTGGRVQIQHGIRYEDVETPNLFTQPDPAKTTNITVQIDQPLLRNFGSDVTLSQVRLQRNAERDDIEALRSQLISIATDIETAYWTVWLAHRDLIILTELLDRGETVRGAMRARLIIDVTPAELADAVARVEDRRGDVMRAQKALRDASDQLKLLINDPAMSIGTDVLVVPHDDGIDAPIRFNLYDSLVTALEHRPEIQRAILSIDNTSIRQLVADNQRLPQLDLQAQVRFSALAGETSRAYRDLTTGEFVDYLIGLAFEMPIGNRAAEAGLRRRRLERFQAVIAYRNTVQGVVAEVKAALRDVVLNFRLIEQTRLFRVAAAENLRSLELQQDLIIGRGPETLNLKLNRQEQLASAEQQEYRALVDYNIALAEMHRSLGTTLHHNRIDFVVPDAESEDDRVYPFFPTYRVPGAADPSANAGE